MGSSSANRHSSLDQIDKGNVSRLSLQWMYTFPYFGLEATPVVGDGVMYVSGPNQVSALMRVAGGNLALLASPLNQPDYLLRCRQGRQPRRGAFGRPGFSSPPTTLT